MGITFTLGNTGGVVLELRGEGGLGLGLISDVETLGDDVPCFGTVLLVVGRATGEGELGGGFCTGMGVLVRDTSI